MPHKDGQVERVGLFKSLFFKCTLMVAICVLAVFAVTELRNHFGKVAAAENGVIQASAQMTQSLSLQLAPVVEAVDADVLSLLASSAMAAAGDAVVGTYVFSASSKELYAETAPGVSAPMA